MQLTNVSKEQLAGLQENFNEDEIFISPAEEKGKFDVNIQLHTELQAWKLFFSGADYCLAKMGRVKL